MITRRQFTASTPFLAAGALALSGCSPEPASDGYDAVAERTWRPGAVTNLSGATLGRELVRCATLAPSSHNTQCWKLALDANGTSLNILPDLAFRWRLTPEGEHDKCARQVRRSAGFAVFVGQTADKAHGVEVGRCYERFALQATAMGIRSPFLNQPVEVAALRPPFAAALGLSGQRPDLVVRFGRGPVLPLSLRRPIEAVLV
jgi:hypothetical protein